MSERADYRREADALDARILAAIDAYALDDAAFDRLACDIFAHQLRYNAPYGAFALSVGVDATALPPRAVDIPAVPAAAFKTANLSTVAIDAAERWFETSGTTATTSGRHILESSALYTAALRASFSHVFLGAAPPLRYLLLVPDPAERPHSSLGFMMASVAAAFGAGAPRWFLHDDTLEFAAFAEALADARHAAAPVCVATTAFALVELLDRAERSGTDLRLPPGSRVMETGGFKGRSRVVARDELYTRAAAAFGLPESEIVAEYGMTELSSQYYDSPASRTRARRVKTAPPWLRPIIVDERGAPVAIGVVGSVRHIDCANRSSVVAIDTEDLGALTPEGLVLIGREEGAQLRGCSLDAETLR